MQQFANSRLFKNMWLEEIQQCLKCAGASINHYKKSDVIFGMLDLPEKVYVVGEGKVLICQESFSGKRNIITTIEKEDIFGEVYVFMDKAVYDYYAIVEEKATVLTIPKAFFYHTCEKTCTQHSKLIANMLEILAHKAYFLNKKIQLLTSDSLRHKIVKYLLDTKKSNNLCNVTMTREQMAAFFNVARPSLSRELLKMQEEGLIKLNKKQIEIVDTKRLENYL